MGKLKAIAKGIRFIWENREHISEFKKELLDVKTKLEHAKKDGTITGEELAGIIREMTDVLDVLADIVESE